MLRALLLWNRLPETKAEAGSRPAGESLSFASPKEWNQRKGDPTVRVPSLRYGQPAMLGQWVHRRTRCAPSALRSNNCGESVHEVRVSFGTRTHPLPCASRHAQKGTQRTSIRAIALLGPAVAAHSARAYRAEQRDGPCDCSAPPCGLRLRRGGCGVSMGVGAPMPCALTCRGCPSGARSAKRVPRRTPQAPRRRFTPSHREGVADWGSPFFWVLFFGEAKKSTSPAGATTRLPPSRQAQGQINAQTQTSTSSARTAGGKTNNYQNNSY